MAIDAGKNFIKDAIKRPGALKKKAHKSGMSTSAFAKSHDKGNSRTAKQSRFAETLAKLRKH